MSLSADAIRDLDAAVEAWLAYKADLLKARDMASNGFAIPYTKGSDFMQAINANSRRAINALGVSSPEIAEALGELFLNAATNMKAAADPNASARGAHLW